MNFKNNADDDEVIEFLRSAGISLSDRDKELIRKTRQDERRVHENLPAEQQLRHLSRLGYSGQALIKRSLDEYLARCRASARTQLGVVDLKQIYESRRAFSRAHQRRTK